MKRCIIPLIILIGAALWRLAHPPGETTKALVCILQTAAHPSLDAVKEHFKQELTSVLGSNVHCIDYNGMGQTSSLQMMMEAIERKPKVDLIVAIATPAAQVAVLHEKKIPILVTAVSDSSVLAIDSSQNNVCGLSDRIEPTAVVEEAKKLLQGQTRVAMLYNPSEVQSCSLIRDLSQAMQEAHLEPIAIGALSPSEMPAAAQKASKVGDLVLAPTDNLVAMTLGVIHQACQSKSKPLLGMDAIAMIHGATASIGIDYAQMGQEAAQMALLILQGTSPQAIGLQTLTPSVQLASKKATSHLSLKATGGL